MKTILTLSACLIFSLGTMAQTNTSPNSISVIQETPAQTNAQPAQESMAFNEAEYYFGKIPQGKPVTHVFEFKNTGTTPFSLDNVQASCGCTTPEWNKDVVAPGATSKIIVGYNAQNEGTFAKPVTITYNGNQTKQIIIKGEVWKTPVDSAPENTKINSLKNE